MLQIRKAAIQTVPDIHPTFIVQRISCSLEHHTEEDAEESWEQDTTILNAIGDGKGLRQVSIESDLAVLVLVQQDHHLWRIGGTAMLFPDKP